MESKQDMKAPDVRKSVDTRAIVVTLPSFGICEFWLQQMTPMLSELSAEQNKCFVKEGYNSNGQITLYVNCLNKKVLEFTKSLLDCKLSAIFGINPNQHIYISNQCYFYSNRCEFMRQVNGCRRCLLNPSFSEGKGKNRMRYCPDCIETRLLNDRKVIRFKKHLFELMSLQTVSKSKFGTGRKNKLDGLNSVPKGQICLSNLRKLDSFTIAASLATRDERDVPFTLCRLIFEFMKKCEMDNFVDVNPKLFHAQCSQLNECPRGELCSFCHFRPQTDEMFNCLRRDERLCMYVREFDWYFGEALFLCFTNKKLCKRMNQSLHQMQTKKDTIESAEKLALPAPNPAPSTSSTSSASDSVAASAPASSATTEHIHGKCNNLTKRRLRELNYMSDALQVEITAVCKESASMQQTGATVQVEVVRHTDRTFGSTWDIFGSFSVSKKVCDTIDAIAAETEGSEENEEESDPDTPCEQLQGVKKTLNLKIGAPVSVTYALLPRRQQNTFFCAPEQENSLSSAAVTVQGYICDIEKKLLKPKNKDDASDLESKTNEQKEEFGVVYKIKFLKNKCVDDSHSKLFDLVSSGCASLKEVKIDFGDASDLQCVRNVLDLMRESRDKPKVWNKVWDVFLQLKLPRKLPSSSQASFGLDAFALQKIDFFPNLNKSQRDVVKNALVHNVHFVQGPPGSGKTHVLVAYLCILLCLFKRAQMFPKNSKSDAIDACTRPKILVAVPTNKGVVKALGDFVALLKSPAVRRWFHDASGREGAQGLDTKDIKCVFAMAPSKEDTLGGIENDVLQACLSRQISKKFANNSEWNNFQKKSRNARNLSNMDKEGYKLHSKLYFKYYSEICENADVIFCTFGHSVSVLSRCPNLTISHVVCDECNQIALPTWLALSGKQVQQVCMFGDVKQLRPVSKSGDIALSNQVSDTKSRFYRTLSLYEMVIAYIETNQRVREEPHLLNDFYTKLAVQYRCHPIIYQIVKSLSYSNQTIENALNVRNMFKLRKNKNLMPIQPMQPMQPLQSLETVMSEDANICIANNSRNQPDTRKSKNKRRRRKRKQSGRNCSDSDSVCTAATTGSNSTFTTTNSTSSSSSNSVDGSNWAGSDWSDSSSIITTASNGSNRSKFSREGPKFGGIGPRSQLRGYGTEIESNLVRFFDRTYCEYNCPQKASSNSKKTFIPILWHNTPITAKEEDFLRSKYNEYECQILRDYLIRAKSCGISESSIAVICGYREGITRVVNSLQQWNETHPVDPNCHQNRPKSNKLNVLDANGSKIGLNVGNIKFVAIDYESILMGSVNAIEGEARDLVLFLGIRNNVQKHLGFMACKERINVALSRAKYAQVIIGNISTLTSCEYYKQVVGVHLQYNAIISDYKGLGQNEEISSNFGKSSVFDENSFEYHKYFGFDTSLAIRNNPIAPVHARNSRADEANIVPLAFETCLQQMMQNTVWAQKKWQNLTKEDEKQFFDAMRQMLRLKLNNLRHVSIPTCFKHFLDEHVSSSNANNGAESKAASKTTGLAWKAKAVLRCLRHHTLRQRELTMLYDKDLMKRVWNEIFGVIGGSYRWHDQKNPKNPKKSKKKTEDDNVKFNIRLVREYVLENDRFAHYPPTVLLKALLARKDHNGLNLNYARSSIYELDSRDVDTLFRVSDVKKYLSLRWCRLDQNLTAPAAQKREIMGLFGSEPAAQSVSGIMENKRSERTKKRALVAQEKYGKELKKVEVEHKTEEDLIDEGMAETPDYLLQTPLLIRDEYNNNNCWHEIYWIDYKNFYLSAASQNSIFKLQTQARRFNAKYGNGAFVFKLGFCDLGCNLVVTDADGNTKSVWDQKRFVNALVWDENQIDLKRFESCKMNTSASDSKKQTRGKRRSKKKRN